MPAARSCRTQGPGGAHGLGPASCHGPGRAAPRLGTASKRGRHVSLQSTSTPRSALRGPGEGSSSPPTGSKQAGTAGPGPGRARLKPCGVCGCPTGNWEAGAVVPSLRGSRGQEEGSDRPERDKVTMTWCHGPACPLGSLLHANLGQLEHFPGIILEEGGERRKLGTPLVWGEGNRANESSSGPTLPANQGRLGPGSLNPGPCRD